MTLTNALTLTYLQTALINLRLKEAAKSLRHDSIVYIETHLLNVKFIISAIILEIIIWEDRPVVWYYNIRKINAFHFSLHKTRQRYA